MGKVIDRIVLYAVLGAALYLLFLAATGISAVSALLALACCFLLIRRTVRQQPSARMTKAQALYTLEQLAYGDDVAAENQLAALLKPDADLSVCYLPRHPSASVSMADVFGAWKQHSGKSSVLLIAPCYADPKARTFARTLQAPAIEIADASRLLPLIRRSDIPPPRVFRGRALLMHIKDLLIALPMRRSCAKHALYGAFLFAVYWITGSAVYLFLAATSLFLAAAAWRMKRA